MFGGLWQWVSPESLEVPYDVLGKEAETLQVGEVSGPILSDDHIFIMKQEAKQAEEVEPFEKVQKEVEARISLERQKQVLDEFNAGIVKRAALNNIDKFIDFCLWRIYVDAGKEF